MKRSPKGFLSIVLIASAVCILLGGCDPYGSKYPDLDADEIWICDEAPIFFLGFDEELGHPPGFVKINGGIESVSAGFLSGGRFDLYQVNEVYEPLLMGPCSFKAESFTVKEIKRDELFNFQYETLTFRLYYEDDVDWIDGWPVPREGQRR